MRIKKAILASSEDLSAGEGLLLWPGEWMVQGLADQFGMAVRVWSEQLDSSGKYLASYRLEYALVPEGSKVEGFSSLAVQDIPLTLSCIVTTTPTLTHPYPHPHPHPHPYPHPYSHPSPQLTTKTFHVQDIVNSSAGDHFSPFKFVRNVLNMYQLQPLPGRGAEFQNTLQELRVEADETAKASVGGEAAEEEAANEVPTTIPPYPTPPHPSQRFPPTTYYLLPTTYYLLPTTYYLLPTTYYLLPTTYYLLPSSEGRSLTLEERSL